MTDDSQEPGVSALFDAYYAVGGEICDRIGHDYESLGHGIRQCSRCNHTK